MAEEDLAVPQFGVVENISWEKALLLGAAGGGSGHNTTTTTQRGGDGDGEGMGMKKVIAMAMAMVIVVISMMTPLRKLLFYKLTDIFTRRLVLIYCNILFRLGTLWCGFATEIVFARVFRGMGAGLTTIAVVVAIIDVVSLLDR
ncbi:hypothetical protein L211DRAFT_839614 [Terfezia boudieri ATCC MYA-4762]|uniref:Major facilitator superfamily (MFS) profile domain-containing protein n=1 Tax=Terfezia boudieri ATCC MYA-4762 TaxID=1051890 RepID=A0A3N4LIH2_9PEZI|nr:hypothetical protein L211DRAFT_839614 [Terfezia boudieri ATCC MYA-4762]